MNLFSIAGEWSRFDNAKLEARIRRRVASRLRWFHRFNLGRLTVHLSLEWRSTKARIRELRANPHFRRRVGLPVGVP